jgi:hypothetical protein
LSAAWRGCTRFATTSRGEFEQIAKDDAKCAMAPCGLAMSRWHRLSNHPDPATTKKDLAEIKRAAALRASERGRAGLDRRAEDIGGLRPGAQHPDRSVKSAHAFGY